MSLAKALTGTTGEFEIQRILGGLGTVMYIFTAPALVWSHVVTVSFDTFCVAYPMGLAACIGSTAGAIALKDRMTARSSAILNQDKAAQPPAA